jgi:hypothetical protein
MGYTGRTESVEIVRGLEIPTEVAKMAIANIAIARWSRRVFER